MSWQTPFPSCGHRYFPSDCFSASSDIPVLDYCLLAAEQLVCLDVAGLCASSNLHFSTQHVDGYSILGDISTQNYKMTEWKSLSR